MSRFAKAIKPYVEAELSRAITARSQGLSAVEFSHLENAHVLGQESTYWHVKVHVLMLLWAIREKALGELVGQLLRIVGAAMTTAMGLVPQGNTGGVNVSPFKVMPIKPEHQKIIIEAKQTL